MKKSWHFGETSNKSIVNVEIFAHRFIPQWHISGMEAMWLSGDGPWKVWGPENAEAPCWITRHQGSILKLCSQAGRRQRILSLSHCSHLWELTAWCTAWLKTVILSLRGICFTWEKSVWYRISFMNGARLKSSRICQAQSSFSSIDIPSILTALSNRIMANTLSTRLFDSAVHVCEYHIECLLSAKTV